MEDRQPRIFAGLLVLVLVWIGVYWMWDPSSPESSLRISVAQPTDQPTNQPDPTAQPEPAITTPDPSPRQIPDEDAQGVIAPEFRTHVVERGELFQDIAQRYYNDRSMWNIIAQANPFVDPRRLREGMRLRVPIDPTNIQGVDAGSENTEPAPPQALTIEYIVQPNDALSIIAQKHYGSSRYADLIFQANRDTLRSPDAIRVGQVLKLPPLETLIDEDAED